jgi:hypothetical protein
VTGARQSDLSGDDIIAPYFGRGASPVNCFSDACSCIRYADPKRIRWTSRTFPENVPSCIHDHRMSLGAATIDAGYCVMSARTPRN